MRSQAIVLCSVLILVLPEWVRAQSWCQSSQDGFDNSGGNLYAGVGPEYAGALHATTANAGGFELWRLDGAIWNPIPFPGSPSNEAALGVTYAGSMYLGTTNPSSGCEVWEYNQITGWARVDPGMPGPGNGGFGDPQNFEIDGMGEYSGMLYVGTGNDFTGCQVWRYDGAPGMWTRVDPGPGPGNGGFSDPENEEANGLVEFDGWLYVSTAGNSSGCQVWRYNRTTWERVDPGTPGPGGFGSDTCQRDARGMVACNQVLYVGTENDCVPNGGCEVWATDGMGPTPVWTQIGDEGLDGNGDPTNEEVSALACFDSELYAGVEKVPLSGAGVWRYLGSSQWSLENSPGFGDSGNSGIASFGEHSGLLFAGTGNGNTGCEVWRYDDRPGAGFCFGDGAGTACPCGNMGGPGEGCANSTGTGAVLSSSGTCPALPDDLIFDAAQLLPGQPALLFVGENAVNGGMGAQFGDGLRCAGMNVVRLGVQVPDMAGGANWGPGLSTQGGWTAGDTRYFQAWYRDPVGGPCASTFNLSNGVAVTFTP